MRAVDPYARARVDVQLAVNDDRITRVDGHRWRERGVVVDLERLAGGRLHLEAFMSPRLNRVVEHGRIERHLSSVGAVDDVLVKAIVVWVLTATTRRRANEDDAESRHCGGAPAGRSSRACPREHLP